MVDMLRYTRGDELEPVSITWPQPNGQPYDFSSGWTFRARIGTGAGFLVEKTTGFTGASTFPNLALNFTAGELDGIASGTYHIDIRATLTATSQDVTRTWLFQVLAGVGTDTLPQSPTSLAVLGDLTVGGDIRAGAVVLGHQPMVFWQHDDDVTIPNAVWTPLPWNLDRAAGHGSWSTVSLPAASTTIAAGSNGQALPQATINVASAAAFAASGYLVINIGGTDRVVKYTGKTATTFTGCTLGVGTMTTSDTVRQARVEFTIPEGGLANAVAEAAWANNATGDRLIRFNFGQLGLVGGTGMWKAFTPTTAANRMHIFTAEQPAVPLVGPANFIEVFQDSGGPLDSLAQGNLDAPRFIATDLSLWP